MTSRKKPVILDLFAGAGGAAYGYYLAGFEIVGVDIEPQPRYPFTFFQADALKFPLAGYDAIHASPPCQKFSVATKTAPVKKAHFDLIRPIRQRIFELDDVPPYVIENVPDSPLLAPVMLCGSSFGLDVRRHRHFETNWKLVPKACDHEWQTPRFAPSRADVRRRGRTTLASVVTVAGGGTRMDEGGLDLWRQAMGISWMTRRELVEAVPPKMTEYIGHQLMRVVTDRQASL